MKDYARQGLTERPASGDDTRNPCRNEGIMA